MLALQKFKSTLDIVYREIEVYYFFKKINLKIIQIKVLEKKNFKTFTINLKIIDDEHAYVSKIITCTTNPLTIVGKSWWFSMCHCTS